MHDGAGIERSALSDQVLATIQFRLQDGEMVIRQPMSTGDLPKGPHRSRHASPASLCEAAGRDSARMAGRWTLESAGTRRNRPRWPSEHPCACPALPDVAPHRHGNERPPAKDQLGTILKGLKEHLQGLSDETERNASIHIQCMLNGVRMSHMHNRLGSGVVISVGGSAICYGDKRTLRHARIRASGREVLDCRQHRWAPAELESWVTGGPSGV